MGLFSKKNIQNLLKKYRTQPSRGLGQNFLIDRNAAKKIILAAKIRSDDTILEIGPGLGGFTQELAKKAKRVIAVEKDGKMVDILKETLKDCKNVEIVQGDILKISLPLKAGLNYKVVANLPFYITAPVIRKFLEAENQPKLMVLMVQKEVAQRICAKPPDMNLFAVSVQLYANPEIISYISKKSFWPRPKVDSAIIRITPLINADKKLINTDAFFKIVKAGFSQPRKQIGNNLSKMLKLEKERVASWLLENNIQPEQRAETLNINDWANLTKNFPKRVDCGL